MKHKDKLFSRLGEIADGDEFVGCNLSQSTPGTEIFPGRKQLTFTRCNLARAIVPDDSIIVDCNTSQMPLPPEPEIVEMVEIEASELAALRVDSKELKRLRVMEINDD